MLRTLLLFKESWLCFLLGLMAFRANAQVNLSTGSAEVALPIFNYSDGNRLATSLSLNYESGSGIRVNQLAGDVGLGWVLNGGGSITRVVRDQPDDQMGGTYGGVLYAMGNLYRPTRETSPRLPEGVGFVPMYAVPVKNFRYSANAIADRQQDEFVFQFNNRSGTFVIGGYGNFFVLDDSKLKIERVEEDMTGQNILTRISKFVITDESGIKYIFSNKETSKILTYQTGTRKRAGVSYVYDGIRYLSAQAFIESNYSVVTKWHLTEIVDPLTGKSIKFSYDNYNVRYLDEIHATSSTVLSGTGTGEETITRADSWIIGTACRLTQVQLPNDTKVNLSYATKERADLPGSVPLSRIAVLKNGEENTGFTFEYKYFSKTNIRDYNYVFPTAELPNVRLMLEKVQRFGRGGAVEKPYIFSYFNDNNGLPGRCDGTRDHWGYFNGNYLLPWNWENPVDDDKISNLLTYYTAWRRAPSVSPAVVRLGALKSIAYPDGGTMEYTYELNDAQSGASRQYTGGVRVAKTTWFDGLSANPNVVREYKYTNADGFSSRWGYEVPEYEYTVSSFTAIPTKGTYSAANLAVDIVNTRMNAVNSAARQLFPSQEAKKASVNSQITMGVIVAVVTFLYNNFVAPDRYEERSEYKIVSSLRGQRLNALPARYARVTVYNGTEADNKGKEVYEFTTDKDFPLQYPQEPYTVRKRYLPSLYGLLKRKRTYTKSGELVTDEYNKYSTNVRELSAGYENYSVDFDLRLTLSCQGSLYNSFENYRGGIITEYYPLAGRSQLEYTIRKDHRDNANFMEYRTDYVYDSRLNLKKVIATNSLGEKIEERIYYPYDYTMTGVLKTMNDNGILSVPISSETWKLSNGGEKMLAARVVKMTAVNTGEIKPEETYILKSRFAVPKETIGEFNPASLLRNASFFTVSDKKVYNSRGELVQSIVNDQSEANIYDDAGEMAIAKVLNAGATDIAFSSFEKNAAGNWILTPPGTQAPQEVIEAVSGARCLNLSLVTKIEKTGLDAGKKYILSYWKQGGNVSVSAAALENETAVVTRGGWTLVTVVVSKSASVTITGSTRIDELRLMPADAIMVTQTFNELNKVSTITDAQNKATYTEYDGLGRMICVRDCDRNIVQTYSYQTR